MRQTTRWMAATAAIALSAVSLAAPATAGCQRYGFSVNDYGKDGPTKDAKDLLDKHIAKKMAERGIAKYTTGTKTVTCELFLNFIVFDEHTCTAEATACWDGTPLPSGQATAAVDATAGKAKPADAKKPESKPAAVKTSAVKPAADAKTAAPAKTESAVPAPETVKTEEPAKAVDAPAPAAIDPVKPAAQ